MQTRCSPPVTGFWIGSAQSLNDPWNFESCSSAIHIQGKVNLSENWIVHLIECRREYLEDGGTGFGIQATHDPKYCFTLLRRGSLIDDRLNLSMTLMNSLRPGTNTDEFEPVEFRITMISMLDIKPEHAFTVSVGGQGVELTRAAIRAVTIQEFLSFKHPLDVRHDMPPHSHSRATAQLQTRSYRRQNQAGEDRDVLPHPRNRRGQLLSGTVGHGKQASNSSTDQGGGKRRPQGRTCPMRPALVGQAAHQR